MPDPAKMREGRSGRATRDTVTAGPCEGRQDRGGAEGKCLYIDTEGTFRPERWDES